MTRMLFDCRDLPGDCTLSISGEADEVIENQARHAMAAHGSQEGPELRGWIQSMLKDEAQPVPESAAVAAVGAQS